jgi:hypothetical protein
VVATPALSQEHPPKLATLVEPMMNPLIHAEEEEAKSDTDASIVVIASVCVSIALVILGGC